MIRIFTIEYPHPYNKIGDGPEGPEVRTVADKLRPLISSTIIEAYRGPRAKTVGFDNLKCPNSILGVRSHGKKLIIDIQGHMIIFSLGMTGRLQYTAGNHSHVSFNLEHCQLYFDDYRYMGSVDIIPHSGIGFYFKDIGPDLLQLALDDKTWIPLDIWLYIFRKDRLKNIIIYKVLKDQSLVSGIGNYLVSEILYGARISPLRKVSSLSDDDWNRIRISAHEVIRLSYSYNGLTIESFISPDGTLGTYPRVVYGKQMDPLGNPVEKLRIDQTAHWVPIMQK